MSGTLPPRATGTRRWSLGGVTIATLTVSVMLAAPGAAASDADASGHLDAPTAAAASCDPVGATVRPAARPADWQPVTAERWRFTDGEVVLTEPGTPRVGPVRPYEHAVVTAGPRLGALHLRAQVRIDTPTSVRDRDVVVLLGYRGDQAYTYVHLSQDAQSSNHNGIFVVDGTDRERIDDQGTGGAPPAISDTAWHDVEVTHCPATGQLRVTVDDQLLLTASDPRIGIGRVGFGSFDNIGRVRDLVVEGAPARVDPCPDGVRDAFDDDTGSPHAAAIDCAAHHDLVRGFADGTVRPSRPVTRGQLGTIVAGTVEAGGGVLPGERGRFPDVVGSPHEVPVERQAAAGIIAGFEDGTFRPGVEVTRAQAATIVDRAVTALRGSPLPRGPQRFDDVRGGPHADAIHRLAAAGIVEGTGERRFDPQRTVTRGQAASLVVRAWTTVEP